MKRGNTVSKIARLLGVFLAATCLAVLVIFPLGLGYRLGDTVTFRYYRPVGLTPPVLNPWAITQRDAELPGSRPVVGSRITGFGPYIISVIKTSDDRVDVVNGRAHLRKTE